MLDVWKLDSIQSPSSGTHQLCRCIRRKIMADIRIGITPSQVDAVALFPVGTEVDDPRNGFTGNRIKYCRANGTIAVGDCVTADVSFATAAERHATVVSTSAVSQVIEGANDNATVSISSGQFFWATVKGRAQIKTSAVTAGSTVGTSATGGTLVNITASAAYAQAEALAALAAAAGKSARATTATGTPVTGQSFILLS